MASLSTSTTTARVYSQLRSQPNGINRAVARASPAPQITLRCSAELSSGQSDASVSRRALGVSAAGMVALSLAPTPSSYAVGFKKELKKRKIPLSDYEAQPEFTWKGETHEGLQVYDVEVGSGKEPQQGNTVVRQVRGAQVHYDCRYRNLLAVSSREARLLGGNRTIAEPYELTFGRVPSEYTRQLRYDTFTGVGMKVYKDSAAGGFFVENITKGAPAEVAGVSRNDKLLSVDGQNVFDLSPSEVGKLLLGEEGTKVTVKLQTVGSEEPAKTYELERAKYKVKAKSQAAPVVEGNGLFAGGSGPKPPAALFLCLAGMKVGGKRSVIVPADLGYGEDGCNEIPPDADYFIMDVEMLDVRGA